MSHSERRSGNEDIAFNHVARRSLRGEGVIKARARTHKSRSPPALVTPPPALGKEEEEHERISRCFATRRCGQVKVSDDSPTKPTSERDEDKRLSAFLNLFYRSPFIVLLLPLSIHRSFSSSLYIQHIASLHSLLSRVASLPNHFTVWLLFIVSISLGSVQTLHSKVWCHACHVVLETMNHLCYVSYASRLDM